MSLTLLVPSSEKWVNTALRNNSHFSWSATEVPANAKMEVKVTGFNLITSPPIPLSYICLWSLSHLSLTNQTKSSFELSNWPLTFANGIGKVVFWSSGVDISRHSEENSISYRDVIVHSHCYHAIQTWAGERKSSETVFLSCVPWSLWVFGGERRGQTSR